MERKLHRRELLIDLQLVEAEACVRSRTLGERLDSWEQGKMLPGLPHQRGADHQVGVRIGTLFLMASRDKDHGYLATQSDV